MHSPCALQFCSAVWFWCIVVRISNFHRSHSSPPWFTILLLSHTDKLFTPHQRRLLPPERHLSALSSLLSVFLSLSVFAFLSSCFHPHLKVNCIPSLVQNPRVFLRCIKNKRPSFYVSCISLICPFISFYLSVAPKQKALSLSYVFDFVSAFQQTISYVLPCSLFCVVL